jgi:hypothetical protein
MLNNDLGKNRRKIMKKNSLKNDKRLNWKKIQNKTNNNKKNEDRIQHKNKI